MTAPVRIRGRRVIRRAAVTQDVAFTLLQLHRPRRDDLRFGLFLFGEALHNLPVEDAPRPVDALDEVDEPQAADQPAPPADQPPGAAAAAAPETEAAADQQADVAAPRPGYATPHDHYGSVQDFHAEEIATGDTPPVADASPDTVVYTNQPATSPAATAPDIIGGEDPGGEDPGGEDPGGVDPGGEDSGGDDPTGVDPGDATTDTPTGTAESPDDGSAGGGTTDGGDPPSDQDDEDDEVPEPQQMPGIYICVEQDVTGGTDATLSVDVQGAYSSTSSGTSDPTLTTYQVIYLADTASADDLPDSVWAAGWQQVILSFQVLDTQSWTQTATVTVDQTGSATGIDVDGEQSTWITETGAIFISAHAEGTALYVDTTATLFTEINQITDVAVRVGTISSSTTADTTDESESYTPDQEIDDPLPIDVDIVQHVWIEQDVAVTVDVEDGLDLSLDALLGQIGTVLQDFDLSVEIEGDEVTLNLCADQEADISQTVSLLLGVDEPSAANRDESGTDDTASATVDQSDDELAAFLEASFAAGDDLAFDDSYYTWAADTAAGETATQETPSGSTTTAATSADGIVDAGAEADADPDHDFDVTDDNKHYAAA